MAKNTSVIRFNVLYSHYYSGMICIIRGSSFWIVLLDKRAEPRNVRLYNIIRIGTSHEEIILLNPLPC